MSRTNRNSGSSSPVKKYLSFSGSKGQVKFYDKGNKNADEKGNVFLDSLDLIILDIKSSISGFNENESSGISSNLLDPYSVGKEEFIVKTKIGGKYDVFAKGVYKEIKEKLATINAKFTTNLFALADFGGGYEVVRLELNGSALQPWIELQDTFENNDDVYDNLISISKGDLLTRKGGKTTKVSKAEYNKVLAAIQKNPMYQRPVWFYAPKFATEPLSEELTSLAIEQDEALQACFETTGDVSEDSVKVDETSQESASAESPKPASGLDGEDDDLPF